MTLHWTARGALRLYPLSWREEYEREVVGTLLDVAENSQRDRPSLTEVVPLAVRGAFLRARSSIIFWFSLPIIAAMLWTLGANTFDGFLSERYLTSMLTRAGAGLPLALPLAGAASAWLASRRRRSTLSVESRLRLTAVDAAIATIPVLIGYLACIVAQLVVSGSPLSAHVNATVLLAYIGMALLAVAVGSLVGSLFPAIFAVPAALAPLLWWFVFSGNDAHLGALSGLSITQSAPTLYFESASNAVGACFTFGLAVAVLAFLVFAVRWMRGRIAMGFVGALALTALVVSTPAMTAWATTGVETSRPESHLLCAGTAPEICLWPEQEAQDGSLVRATVTAAHGRGVALGLPMPARVSVAGSEDNPHSLYWRGVATEDRVLTNFAQAYSHQFACEGWMEWPEEKLVRIVEGLDMGFASAEYATAVAFGANLDAALPVVQIGGDASEPAEKTLSPDEARDYLGVHSLAEAEKLTLAWVAAGQKCE